MVAVWFAVISSTKRPAAHLDSNEFRLGFLLVIFCVCVSGWIAFWSTFDFPDGFFASQLTKAICICECRNHLPAFHLESNSPWRKDRAGTFQTGYLSSLIILKRKPKFDQLKTIRFEALVMNVLTVNSRVSQWFQESVAMFDGVVFIVNESVDHRVMNNLLWIHWPNLIYNFQCLSVYDLFAKSVLNSELCTILFWLQ